MNAQGGAPGLFHGFSSPNRGPLTLWGRALGAATFIHLALPDFEGPGWWVAGLLKGLGAALLLYRASALGFLLCALGSLLSLLFLRDVLTQSAYLLTVSFMGLWGCLRGSAGVHDAVRMVTAATYGVAAFHKLNTGFFDPDISCASHVVRQVADFWPSFEGVLIPGVAWPVFALALELVLAVLIWRRHPWMWILGLCFHLPLTATLAPAFGPVMLSGYVAATHERDGVRARALWRTHHWVYVFSGVGFGTLLTGLHPGENDFFLAAKMGAAGTLLTWWLHLVCARGRRRAPSRVSPWAFVVLGVWVLNGLSPYAGWQYQHTAAMLSNLRIDQGCANHMLFGAYPPPDAYVRIDHARIGDGQRPHREKILVNTLWNRAALATMRRNWCIPELRPIAIKGHHENKGFQIPDLCSDQWVTHAPSLKTFWPGMQRFQKNLPRSCEQACIH